MPTAPKVATALSVKVYKGDAKTLLAFDLPKSETKGLAGFTIQVQPEGKEAYYLYNNLQLEDPSKHAQDKNEPPNSSINAPIHMFRWLHVPGSAHQGLKPVWGKYTYTVTPRYFDVSARLLPLDPQLSVATDIDVSPFEIGNVALGFTRGYTQSQAFVRHFGKDAQIRPKGKELLFDTDQVSGKNAAGDTYTFTDEYEWLGFTAHDRIFAVLDEVLKDKNLTLDVFGYDLNEPRVADALLKLAADGRVRIVLDNSAIHVDGKTKQGTPKPAFEDAFERLFKKQKKGASAIQRGKFGRYSHDKIFIVSDTHGPKKVLTGSTNFSVTGLYVNSNHVLVFEDRTIAKKYKEVFDEAWTTQVKLGAFRDSELSTAAGFNFVTDAGKLHVTFSPHTKDDTTAVLGELVTRVEQETQKPAGKGSVLFAVMELDSTGKQPNMVYTALRKLHANPDVFTAGISDSTEGINLYKPGTRKGILATGKPIGTQLPPPFNQVPNIGGVGHQIHHKFVVCGFNSDDAVVYCGSSNLAEGGENNNGDNLIAFHSKDVATVFAIEALALVDHFNFLDKYSKAKAKLDAKTGTAKTKTAKAKTKTTATTVKHVAPPAEKAHAAKSARWFLDDDDHWVAKYYDKNDLKFADRELFG